MNPLVVLVVAADPLARAGLASLLAKQVGLTVIEASPEDDVAALADDLDALVWDGESELEPPDFYAFSPPVLVLVSEATGVSGLLAAGASGVVERSSSGERLAAALRALNLGMVVLEPMAAAPLATSAEALPEALTPREEEVLALVAEGLANKAIAKRLEVSEHTVKFHLSALLGKFGVSTRTELVVKAIQAGRVSL